MSEEKQYYRVAEFARRTGMSESTLRRRIKNGFPHSQDRPRALILIPHDALKQQAAVAAVSAPPAHVEVAHLLPGPAPRWLGRQQRQVIQPKTFDG